MHYIQNDSDWNEPVLQIETKTEIIYESEIMLEIRKGYSLYL